MGSCLKRLGDKYDRLTYSEKIVADYIFSHARDVVRLSIRELSAATGIAPSTISNMLKKLQIDGYTELKLLLASEINNTVQNSWRSESGTETPDKDNICRRVVDTNMEALRTVKTETLPAHYEKAASMLLQARNIYVFGVGTSSILASEAADYLCRLGLRCSFSQDYHHQLIAASFATAEDAALVVSQSGINRDIIQVAQMLQKREVPSIGLSNYGGTPFSRYIALQIAPFASMCTTHENNFTFRIPILCMIEILYYQLAGMMGTDYDVAMNHNRQLVTGQAIHGGVADVEG